MSRQSTARRTIDESRWRWWEFRRVRILIAASTLMLASALIAGCGGRLSHSARDAAMQSAVIASIERLGYLEPPPGRSLSNVQCVAWSDSAMTCVGYRGGSGLQTTYMVSIDDTNGRYIITSNTSRQVETGAEGSHPEHGVTGRAPSVFLDGKRVAGIGPRYRVRSSSITLTGLVVPHATPLTVSGVATTPATDSYGYHPIAASDGTFTLTLPLAPGENDFQISRGTEIIVTFTAIRRP